VVEDTGEDEIVDLGMVATAYAIGLLDVIYLLLSIHIFHFIGEEDVLLHISFLDVALISTASFIMLPKHI